MRKKVARIVEFVAMFTIIFGAIMLCFAFVEIFLGISIWFLHCTVGAISLFVSIICIFILLFIE